ncbi:MAG TPA: hypothetical protein VFS56_12175 [Gemmatimonadaceae bacterium]|nr:hypothetical protein [Gemmatimonadaceae bacterium]
MRSLLLGATLSIAAAGAQSAGAQAVERVGGRFHGLGKYAHVATGDHVIPAGTTTSGSVLVMRGNLDVYGNVDGAATAVGGDVIVHKGGRVRGGAVALMGHVRNEGGSILGVIKDVGTTHNRQAVSFGGRPRTTLGSLASAILWLFALLLVGTFVLFFLGDYFRRAVEVVTQETGRSLFTGVLGGIAIVPAMIALVIVMAVTIIGIFFIPIGVGAFLVLVSGIAMLGFLAVAHVAGVAVSGKSGSETPAGEELQYLYTGILAFSALWIIAAAFTWFPIVGSILRVLAFSVTLVAVATGFGAVILSWWRTRPRKNAVAV